WARGSVTSCTVARVSWPRWHPLRKQGEHEVEVAVGAHVQQHLAARVAEGTGATGDRQLGVRLRVDERPLDGDLPTVQERRPHALPAALRRACADAVALV